MDLIANCKMKIDVYKEILKVMDMYLKKKKKKKKKKIFIYFGIVNT